jgi:hypothetical protein
MPILLLTFLGSAHLAPNYSASSSLVVRFAAAQKALGTVRLESTADAAAILKLVRTNLKQFGELADWEKVALNNASKFLDRSVAWA